MKQGFQQKRGQIPVFEVWFEMKIQVNQFISRLQIKLINRLSTNSVCTTLEGVKP